MVVRKISKAGRVKTVAVNPATVFIHWNAVREYYEGIVEVTDSNTGDKYQLISEQIAWEDVHAKMRELFEKDAHA